MHAAIWTFAGGGCGGTSGPQSDEIGTRSFARSTFARVRLVAGGEPT